MCEKEQKGRKVSILLREWEAVVLTVQEHGRVYVKQLPKLLAWNQFVSSKINESRDTKS